jgi:hypothetical protein
MAGTLAILLSFFYALFYTALLIPLCVVFLSIALMWRNSDERRLATLAAEKVKPGPALPAQAGA